MENKLKTFEEASPYRKALIVDMISRKPSNRKARPNSIVYQTLIHEKLTEEEIDFIFSKYEISSTAIDFIKEYQDVSGDFFYKLKCQCHMLNRYIEEKERIVEEYHMKMINAYKRFTESYEGCE